MNDKNVYLVRESAWQSIVSDICTFAFMGGLLVLNNYVLGNHPLVAAVLIIFATIAVSGQSNIKRFKNKEELIKHLQND